MKYVQLTSKIALVSVLLLMLVGLNSCQKSVDSSAADISALKASVSALQKTTDSLAKALAATNNNVANLSAKVDSIKAQIVIVQNQITILNTQLTTTNANITVINAQIVILNQQYITLLAQLNAILAQLSVTPNSLSSGLVAWYPFSGNANDSSGNGNNGTVYGATLVADRFGKPSSAYSFNGINNYISTANSNSLSINGDITMVAWIFDYGASNHYHTILNKRINSNWSYDLDYSFYYGPGGSPTEVNKIFTGRRFNTTIPSDYQFSNDTISFNQWQCVIVTIQNNMTTFYLNGKNAGYNINGNIFANPMVDQPVGLTIGSANPGEWMSGIIDDIRIYNRALTQQEISYLSTH